MIKHCPLRMLGAGALPVRKVKQSWSCLQNGRSLNRRCHICSQILLFRNTTPCSPTYTKHFMSLPLAMLCIFSLEPRKHCGKKEGGLWQWWLFRSIRVLGGKVRAEQPHGYLMYGHQSGSSSQIKQEAVETPCRLERVGIGGSSHEDASLLG